jgi:hypothetical protein
MSSETAPYPQVPPPPTPATAGRGWTGSDLAIGGALVVLLIALFLPWFSSTVRLNGATASVSGSADGLRAHGYLWIAFALAILGLIVLVGRDAIGRLPGNLPTPAQMLVGASGLGLLLTILGLAVRPSSGLTVVRPSAPIASFLPLLPRLSISVGWSYGGFIALVAALIAFAAAFRAAGPVQSGRHLTMPSLRGRGTTA